MSLPPRTQPGSAGDGRPARRAGRLAPPGEAGQTDRARQAQAHPPGQNPPGAGSSRPAQGSPPESSPASAAGGWDGGRPSVAEAFGEAAPAGQARGARPGAAWPGAASSSGVEAMDRLSRHLTAAGFRLASLRRRLAAAEEQMMVDQVSDELDEALAQIRGIAFAFRRPSP